MAAMKRRPFSELTRDWPPEHVASSEAKTREMLAELDRQQREKTRDERMSGAAPERAPSRSSESTRRS